MVKVTVFMAVYNGAAYLKESIDSILNQTFKDFELLIIDDGSTDNSVEIVNTYNDFRIRLLQNEKNEGLIYTRNRSVKEARGKYLAVLDCDDLATPNRLMFQYNYLEQNPEIALCGGHNEYIDGKGELLSVLKFPLKNLDVEMLFLNVFINSALMIKVDAIKQVGGYKNYRCAGDFDLSLRISDEFKISNLDEILVKYRLHNTNMSSTQNDLMIKEELSIINDMHTKLGLTPDDYRRDIHHALYVHNHNKFNTADITYLLESLKEANNKCKKYDVAVLNSYLYQKWYDILRIKREKGVLKLFLTSKLLSFSDLTFKHFRKIFKQSLGFKS